MSTELYGDKGREGIPIAYRGGPTGGVTWDEALDYGIKIRALPSDAGIYELVLSLQGKRVPIEQDLAEWEDRMNSVDEEEFERWVEEHPDTPTRFAVRRDQPFHVVEVSYPAGVGGQMEIGGAVANLEARTWPALVKAAREALEPLGYRIHERKDDALGRRGLAVFSAAKPLEDYHGTVWARPVRYPDLVRQQARVMRAQEEAAADLTRAERAAARDRFALTRPGSWPEPLRRSDFVVDASGSANLGEIGDAVATAIRRQAGPIRLRKAIDTIIARKHPELDERPGELVGRVAQGYTKVLEGRGHRLLLVRNNGRTELAVVELRPAEGADHYEVVTAMVVRPDYLKGKPVLWERAQSAQPPAEAVSPEEEVGSPGAISGQSSDTANVTLEEPERKAGDGEGRFALAPGPENPDFQLTPEKRADTVRRKMIDSMVRVERTQEVIEELVGETIGDALDVYRVAMNYSGRVTERQINEVRRPYLEPLKRLMLRSGVSLDELDLFLYARHAPERNDYLFYLHVLSKRVRGKAELAAEKERREVVGDENPKRVEALVKELSTVGGKHPVSKLLQALGAGFDAARAPLVELAGQMGVDFDPALRADSEDQQEAGRARAQQAKLKAAWWQMDGSRRIAMLDRWLGDAGVRDALREVGAIPHSGMTDREADEAMVHLEGRGLVQRRREDITRHMTSDEAIEALGKIDYSMPPEDVERAVAEVRAAWRRGLEAHLSPRGSAVYGGKLAQLAAIVDRATQRKLRVLLEAGLESEETIEKLMSVYEYYVPLKGNELKGNLDEWFAAKGRSVGQGFDIRGDDIQHGLGRFRKAANPVTAQVFLDLETAIVRDEKNKVGLALKRMIEEFPDAVGETGEKLWEINPVKERWIINDEGDVTSIVDLAANDKEWVISVKQEGQEYYLHLYDGLLARAMKNLGAEPMSTFVKVHGRFQRQIASWLTSRNPGFIPVNFIRDLGTAGIHLSAAHGGKFATAVLRDVRHTLPAVLGAERAMERVSEGADEAIQPEHLEAAVSGEWQEWWRRFRKAGAMTGWSAIETIQDRATTLEKEIRDMGPGSWKTTRRAVRQALEVVEGINMGVENAIRLSAFRHAVEDLGMSELKAASYARDLTVNFNRKGEWGSWANTLFMFANAGLQGMDTVVQHFRRHPKAMSKWMGALYLAGYLLALFNRWSGGDDEEDGRDRWERVTAGTKERNLVIMFPKAWGLDGVKVPLPIAYNLPFFLGTVTEQLTHDLIVGRPVRTQMVAGHLAAATANAFNPLSGDWLTSPLPTVLDAPIQIAANQNFWGGPIYPVAYPGDIRPDSERYFPGASWTSRMLARGVNRLTGGDEFEPGIFSFSPESVDHMVNAWGGALVQIGKQLVDLSGVLAGEPFSVRQLPIASRFLAETSDWTAAEEYRAAVTELDRARAREKAYRERGDIGRAQELRREVGGLLSPARGRQLDALEKRIREARKRNDRVLETRLQKQYVQIYDLAATDR